ncbi:MAG: hypothetical protein HY921_00405 [Elusimicrobia bacterium]|nr:hypothetical protein [Elusimicrobiota bacterium]
MTGQRWTPRPKGAARSPSTSRRAEAGDINRQALAGFTELKLKRRQPQ